jgi:hypothetical protein
MQARVDASGASTQESLFLAGDGFHGKVARDPALGHEHR